MSPFTRSHLSALALLALGGAAVGLAPPPPRPAPYVPPKLKASGPHTHGNLTVFFLRGADQLKGKVLTLDEALRGKKVVVHETQSVNRLSVENTGDEAVFIQAGDIVKGGQQDRVLAIDLLVPGKSGKVPIEAFCVESGRWAQRPGENVKAFSASAYSVVGNDLKLAARQAKDQGKVWDRVGRVQDTLGENLKGNVRAATSRTSLQLTLEHKKVKEAVEAAVKKLHGKLGEKDGDVVGVAVAINGKVTAADVYASAALFRKLWPKLLHAAATEAVALKKDGAKVPEVKADAVTAFLAGVAKGKRTVTAAGKDGREVQLEAPGSVLFETRGKGDVVLRRSWLAK
jgi:hypothetical protein